MKKVEWLGEKRIIPKMGEVSKGVCISLDDKVADSFIKQGLAKPVKKFTEVNTTEEKAK